MSNFHNQTILDIMDVLPTGLKKPRIFIETGTLHANSTVLACIHFDKVYSIELSPELWATASEKFPGGRITFLHGDSAKVLPEMLEHSFKEEGVFFYLDAHFFTAGAKGKPIAKENPFPLWDELEAIRKRRGVTDIVVVDDVHAFGRKDPHAGWETTGPETIKASMEGREVLHGAIMGDQYVMVVQ